MMDAGWLPFLYSATMLTSLSAGTPASDFISPRAAPLVPWQVAQVAARLRASVQSWACAATLASSSTAAAMRGMWVMGVSLVVGRRHFARRQPRLEPGEYSGCHKR